MLLSIQEAGGERVKCKLERGKITLIPENEFEESVFIQSKARQHSRKPDALYGIIESLPLKSRIELFCRNRRQGWDHWGNQLSKDIQNTLTSGNAH